MLLNDVSIRKPKLPRAIIRDEDRDRDFGDIHSCTTRDVVSLPEVDVLLPSERIDPASLSHLTEYE